MSIYKISILIFLTILFVGCNKTKTEIKEKKKITKNIIDPSTQRWYSKEMVKYGKPIYEKHCSSCHGLKGEGQRLEWNVKISREKYPIPSLGNGSHAINHSLKGLRLTLKDGGKPIGGLMPSFKDKLTKEDIDETIAYFQNFWNKDNYEKWLKNSEIK